MKRTLIPIILIILSFSLNAQRNSSSNEDKKAQRIFSPSLKIILPVNAGSLVNGTPITPILKYSSYKQEYGIIKSFGFGFGVDARLTDNIHPFLEGVQYNYKQELADKGADVHYTDNIGMPFMMNLPNGAKYITKTAAFKLGLKYVFTKNEYYQPWIGAAYGLYVWDLKYSDWDEATLYGLDKGTSTRFTYRLGLDIQKFDLVSLTFYFDANAPVADYTIDNLFIVGKTEHVFDGHLFPVLNFGMSVGAK